jgi:hypothetical protein
MRFIWKVQEIVIGKGIEFRVMYQDGQSKHLYFEAPSPTHGLMPIVPDRCC